MNKNVLESAAGSDFFVVVFFSGSQAPLDFPWLSLLLPICVTAYKHVKDQVRSRILNGKFVPIELVPRALLFSKGRKKNFPIVPVARQG